ncbi:MAG TPA: hypothetical protein VKH37_05530, partial [Ferruginibacter sp.]|nr:hypothetical protein [Ferruginibacter sp.]
VQKSQQFIEWINHHIKKENFRFLDDTISRTISQYDIDGKLREVIDTASASDAREKKLMLYMTGMGITNFNDPVFCIPGVSNFGENEAINIGSYMTGLSEIGVFDSVNIFYDLKPTDQNRNNGALPVMGSVTTEKRHSSGMALGYFNDPDLDAGQFTATLVGGLKGNAIDDRHTVTAQSLGSYMTKKFQQTISVFQGTNDFDIITSDKIATQKLQVIFPRELIGNQLQFLGHSGENAGPIMIDHLQMDFDMVPGVFEAKISPADVQQDVTVEYSDKPVVVAINWKFKEKWVGVVGTSTAKITDIQIETAKAIGEFLANAGYGLLSGAFAGVDDAVSRSYIGRLAELGITDTERFLTCLKLPDALTPGYKCKVEPVSNTAWASTMVDRSIAIVAVGGDVPTGRLYTESLKTDGHVFIPLKQTGGFSEQVVRDMGETSNAPSPLVEKILRLNEFASA